MTPSRIRVLSALIGLMAILPLVPAHALAGLSSRTANPAIGAPRAYHMAGFTQNVISVAPRDDRSSSLPAPATSSQMSAQPLSPMEIPTEGQVYGGQPVATQPYDVQPMLGQPYTSASPRLSTRTEADTPPTDPVDATVDKALSVGEWLGGGTGAIDRGSRDYMHATPPTWNKRAKNN